MQRRIKSETKTSWEWASLLEVPEVVLPLTLAVAVSFALALMPIRLLATLFILATLVGLLLGLTHHTKS